MDDRIAGVLLGAATGDALGAGYEFGSAPFDGAAAMIGGGLGGFAPGEWTDDTAMATAVAEVTAAGRVDLTAIAGRFLDWFASGPPDVGNQTRSVLSAADGRAEAVVAAAVTHLARRPHGSAGNGALMRTGAVALAHLGDDDAILDAAHAVSALTHADPLSGEACALWCVAIDRAVREQRLDGIHDGLRLLPPERAEWWQVRIFEAETGPPERFTPNGFVVTALQAAHAAVHATPVPSDDPSRHLQDVLHRVIGIGDDTDTTAAIAGQLLGGRWGASAVPEGWRRLLHGWPGLDADDLVTLALATAGGAAGRDHASGSDGAADPHAPAEGGPGTWDGDDYQRRVEEATAADDAPHGEADLVASYRPLTVLDAGCGTGRVAVELHRRGLEVVGVDVDTSMLSTARRLAPDQAWVHADLTGLDLARTFDVVLLAGNVPLFTPPGTTADLVAACARHVADGGVLIAGFSLGGDYALATWDREAEAAGLQLVSRWSTWDRDPFDDAAGYVVTVHTPG